VTGETGLGLTDMEFFDVGTLTKLDVSRDALKKDARAISMMAMVLYYDSFRILKKRISDAKDEWLSMKEFIEFHGPQGQVH